MSAAAFTPTDILALAKEHRRYADVLEESVRLISSRPPLIQSRMLLPTEPSVVRNKELNVDEPVLPQMVYDFIKSHGLGKKVTIKNLHKRYTHREGGDWKNFLHQFITDGRIEYVVNGPGSGFVARR